MAQVEIILPKMGESVTEATIVEWLKEEGDHIEEDEFIVNIATDKVDNEVPSPTEGVLVKKMFDKDDVVQVGQVIGVIETEGDAVVASPAPAAETAPSSNGSSNGTAVSTPAATPIHESAEPEVAIAATAAELTKNGPSGRFYSPLVRSIAKTEGVSMAELEAIAGSGKEGRVTKKDILNYLPNRNGGAAVATPPAVEKKIEPVKTVAKAAPAIKGPDVVAGQGDEIIEMDRMRKLIADHMVMSKTIAPHVTSFVEADVTNLVMWRNRVKKEFQAKHGEKITFTPLFLEAVVKALQDYPAVNSSIDGDKIIIRKDINVGMATALPSGNLIVPVIHQADQLNLIGLAKRVNDLANRARNNALKPEEISGGTYTISNVGTFGNVMGTPIINQPQAAILALGAIRKKPAVIETPAGDTIGIRHMMFLSHSYDHRNVDGALGGSFVQRVAEYLEAFDLNREF